MGLFTQGWRPGRTVGEAVGGILKMDDWSNVIRHHALDIRSDIEFKVSTFCGTRWEISLRFSENGSG